MDIEIFIWSVVASFVGGILAGWLLPNPINKFKSKSITKKSYTPKGFNVDGDSNVLNIGDGIVQLPPLSEKSQEFVIESKIRGEIDKTYDLRSYKALIRLNKSKKDYTEAYKIFIEANSRYPEDIELIIEGASILIKQNSHDNAKLLLEKTIEIRPEHSSLYVELCDLLAKSDIHEAIKVAELGLKNAQSAILEITYQNLYRQLRSEQKDLENRRQKSFSNPSALANYIKYSKDPNELIEIFETIFSGSEHFKTIDKQITLFNVIKRLNKGLYYHDKALSLCERVINSKLKNYRFVNYSGRIFKKFLKQPEHAKARWESTIESKSAKTEEKQNALLELIMTFGDNYRFTSDVLFYLNKFRETVGKLSDSTRNFIHIYAKEPLLIILNKGDENKASSIANDVLRYLPVRNNLDNSFAFYSLAKYYKQVNNHFKAKEMASESLHEKYGKPNNRLVKDFLKSLSEDYHSKA